MSISLKTMKILKLLCASVFVSGSLGTVAGAESDEIISVGIDGLDFTYPSSRWERQSGVFTNKGTGNTMPEIKVKASGMDRFVVGFAAKVVAGSDEGTHFGVYCDFEDGRTIQLYSWTNRFNLLETEAGKELRHITVGTYKEKISVGENADFTAFSIEMKDGDGEVYRDGQKVGAWKFKPGAASQFRFYVWGGEVAIKEIEVKIPAAKK